MTDMSLDLGSAIPLHEPERVVSGVDVVNRLGFKCYRQPVGFIIGVARASSSENITRFPLILSLGIPSSGRQATMMSTPTAFEINEICQSLTSATISPRC